jgi:hypothetical protein
MRPCIKYIVYEVSPCKLGNFYRYVLEFYDDLDADLFILLHRERFDYNNTCLKFMKVLY